MQAIEDIWEQGSNQTGQDTSFGSEAILKSIAEGSRGITATWLKPLWFGLVVAVMASLMLIYNTFFYWKNLPLMIALLMLVIISIGVIIYLWTQIRLLKSLDHADLNLRDLLVYKIKYLNTRYSWALHCISLSIVLATFTINLSMENSDGVFELRKILLLSVFYLFAYLFTFGLNKLSLRVVDMQLKNALFNLEEQTIRGLDEELKKHRRVTRIIATCLIILVLVGITFMLLS